MLARSEREQAPCLPGGCIVPVKRTRKEKDFLEPSPLLIRGSSKKSFSPPLLSLHIQPRMNFPAIAAALPATARTTFAGLPFPHLASGKVREIYDLGDALLLVASDRLSAFDVILPDGIPGKGIILTQMSLWWFAQTQQLIQNHLLPDQAGEFARRGINDPDLQLRSMIVRKLKPLTIECVARGYLIGSGWSSYQKTGEVCGIRLPAGLR